MTNAINQDLAALIQPVLAKADEVRNGSLKDREYVARAYTGFELMKLVDVHGLNMMETILTVDKNAAIYAAASLAFEDRHAFFAINPSDPGTSCMNIAKYYLDKKSSFVSLGLIDERGSITEGYANMRAALTRVVTKSSTSANEVYDRELASQGITLFSEKFDTLFDVNKHVSANELDQNLAATGLPSLNNL